MLASFPLYTSVFPPPTDQPVYGKGRGGQVRLSQGGRGQGSVSGGPPPDVCQEPGVHTDGSHGGGRVVAGAGGEGQVSGQGRAPGTDTGGWMASGRSESIVWS